MVKYWAAWALCSGLTWPVLAAAQQNPPGESPPTQAALDGSEACVAPSAEDTEAAKQAFRDGQSVFSEGDYARAAELWNWAYERDCTAHALLLNLAMAQELLGQPDQAIRSLTRFDERVPESPYVPANRKRIARLQRTPIAPVLPRRDARETCLPPPAASVAEPERASWLPLGVAAGGAAAALLGGAFYLEARHAAATASDGCGGRAGACTNLSAALSGEQARGRAQTAGWIAGAGLTTLAGGLVWHFLGSHHPEGLHARAQPWTLASSLAAGGMAVSLAGGF